MSPLGPGPRAAGLPLAALGSAPQTLLFGCTATAVLAALVWVFARSTTAGIALVLGASVQAGFVGLPGALITIGGVGLTWPDVLTVAAILVGLGRLTGLGQRWGPGFRQPSRGALPALLLLLLLVGFAFLLGVDRFGLKPAGLEVRSQFLAVFGSALYVATAPRSLGLLRGMLRVWPAGAAVLCVGALMWWTAHGVGSSRTQILLDGQLSESRALDAPAALVIGQAAVMLLSAPRYGGRARLCALPLILVVLLLQHRTVWVCTAVMLAGWLLLRRVNLDRRLVEVGLTAAALTGLLICYGLGVFGAAGTSLSTSATDDQTLLWREAGWTSLLGTFHSPFDWLFGFPFGSGYEREVLGLLVDVSPHNFFLQLLLRIGALGLLAFLAVYAVSLCRAGSRSGTGLLLGLLAVGQLVFCVTYQLFMEQGLLLGLLVHHSRLVQQDPGGSAVACFPSPPAQRGATLGARRPQVTDREASATAGRGRTR